LKLYLNDLKNRKQIKKTYLERWIKLNIGLNIRVNYVAAPCASFFITGGTCAMEKDRDGTPVQFSVQN
jgi:hypothetical protein